MHLLVFVYASIQNVKMNRIHFNTFEWKGGGAGGGGGGVGISRGLIVGCIFFAGRWAYDWGGGVHK